MCPIIQAVSFLFSIADIHLLLIIIIVIAIVQSSLKWHHTGHLKSFDKKLCYSFDFVSGSRLNGMNTKNGNLCTENEWKRTKILLSIRMDPLQLQNGLAQNTIQQIDSAIKSNLIRNRPFEDYMHFIF